MLLRAGRLVEDQHGLITRRQAIDAGYDDRDLRRLVSSGSWVRLRRGVYVDRDRWDDLDLYRGRPLLRVRAARLSLACEHVVSHDSAALAHGIGVPDPVRTLVHVTRKKVHGDAVRAGVKHHLAPYHAAQVRPVEGLPVLDLARTALDLAREHGLVAGVAACDQVLRRGVSRSQLRTARAGMWCWPGSRVMDEAIDLADPGSDSWLESEGRVFVTGLGLGRPQTQFGLTDGVRTAYCDLRIDRHVFEIDGLGKYDGDPAGRLAEEKARQDFVAGFKLGITRLTAHDLRAGRRAAEARSLREYADTCARFGTDISDLAPYLARPRRP
jgi:hypothetical protein